VSSPVLVFFFLKNRSSIFFPPLLEGQLEGLYCHYDASPSVLVIGPGRLEGCHQCRGGR